MDRKTFLAYLKAYDDNYALDDEIRELIIKEHRTDRETYKTICTKENYPLQWYSQIDYSRITNLTLHKQNPFSPFCAISTEALAFFVNTLNQTNRFKRYFEERSFDRLRSYEERMSLMRKYDEVIQDMKHIKLLDDKTIETLENRKATLKQSPTLTKRRIYENFLFWCVFALRYDKQSESAFDTPSPTQKEANIVNTIIGDYFVDTIRFSKAVNFNNFKTHTYYIETQHPDKLLHTQMAY